MIKEKLPPIISCTKRNRKPMHASIFYLTEFEFNVTTVVQTANINYKIRRLFLAPNTQKIEAQYDIIMHVANHGMVYQHST